MKKIPDNPQSGYIYSGYNPPLKLMAAFRMVGGKLRATWHSKALREDFGEQGVWDGLHEHRMLFPTDGVAYLTALARNLSRSSTLFLFLDQNPLEVLDRVFMYTFRGRDVRLPLLQGMTHGQISRDGWRIDWLLRSRRGLAPSAAEAPFVDVYTTHRMTNSGHIRIHASGNVVQLPCEHPIFSTFHVEGDEEMERRQRWYQGFHERLYAFLGRKFAAQSHTSSG